MKNKVLIAAVFALFAFSAQAQRPTSFLELGGYGMSQNYLGDVNGNSLSAFTQEAKFGAGAQLKYNFSSLLSVGADQKYTVDGYGSCWWRDDGWSKLAIRKTSLYRKRNIVSKTLRSQTIQSRFPNGL